MVPDPVRAEILIIGAGPAGLVAGCELRRRGVKVLLLERGQPGDSWLGMPSNLRLVSPWRANHLAGFAADRFPGSRAVTAGQYQNYLSDYARASSLPIRTGVNVRRVCRRSRGFEVETDQGRFSSPVVINATGYFSRPFVPSIPGADTCPIPQAHFAQWANGEVLRQLPGPPRSRTVLVVGQRLSAAHLVPELVAAGCQVLVSHRSPLAFGPPAFRAWIAFRLLPELEQIRLALRGPACAGFAPLMPQQPVLRWIGDGTVRAVGQLERFAGAEVVCAGGDRIRPDLVLWATGFRPALSHLDGLTLDPRSGRPLLNGFESAEQPGLFFLGLDGLRDFRSRFLRGIRADAAVLAAQLATQPRSVSRTDQPSAVVAASAALVP